MNYCHIPAIMVDFLGQSSHRGGNAFGSYGREFDDEAIYKKI